MVNVLSPTFFLPSRKSDYQQEEIRFDYIEN